MDLNASLATLLENLSTRLSEDDQEIVRATLQHAQDDLISHTSAMSVRSQGKRVREASPGDDEPDGDRCGEAFVTASVGSNDHVDMLNEDLMRNREARETGYIGQNSEIQWLRSVQRQSEAGNSDPYGQRYGPPGSSREAADARAEALHDRRKHTNPGSMGYVTDTTFYLDSDNIEVDIAVDPYEMPNLNVAERLFDCYVNTVHDTFPLIPLDFEDQFRQYIRSIEKAQAFRVPDPWRATMNLIFAIGAKYSHLIDAPWKGDERDHLIYMTRGVHLLGLKNTVMIISGPNLQLVQATGALAFYFLVIGHVSRAWVMIGLSMRLAMALGLHLRNEDPTQNDAKREPLIQTWWCLHSIECLVSSITGRPPVIAPEDCTVSLPKMQSRTTVADVGTARPSSRRRTDHNVSSSNPSLEGEFRSGAAGQYFLHYTDITLISQRALLTLYSPRTAAQSWLYVQNKVAELLNELEKWAKVALPLASTSNTTRQSKTFRHGLLLKVSHLSTKILITRPCLCRIERRISGESNRSVSSNVKFAEICVEAARELTTLFPDRADPRFIYSDGPWWDVVHIIMQSLAVLLLDMAYRGKQGNGQEDHPHIGCVKKLIRWLRAMEVHDPVAKRAHHVIRKILSTYAPALQSQAQELLAEDQENHDGYQPHVHPPNHAPYSEQDHSRWKMSESTNETSGQTQPPAFDEARFPPAVPSPRQESEYRPYPPFPLEQTAMPMTFGGTFATGFDQGPPYVNMQGLWEDQVSAFDQSMANIDVGYPLPNQPLDPELQGYWQQPYPVGMMAGNPDITYPLDQSQAPR